MKTTKMIDGIRWTAHVAGSTEFTEVTMTEAEWARWQDIREAKFRAGVTGGACTLAQEIGGPITILAPGKQRLRRCAANGEVKDLTDGSDLRAPREESRLDEYSPGGAATAVPGPAELEELEMSFDPKQAAANLAFAWRGTDAMRSTSEVRRAIEATGDVPDDQIAATMIELVPRLRRDGTLVDTMPYDTMGLHRR